MLGVASFRKMRFYLEKLSKIWSPVLILYNGSQVHKGKFHEGPKSLWGQSCSCLKSPLHCTCSKSVTKVWKFNIRCTIKFEIKHVCQECVDHKCEKCTYKIQSYGDFVHQGLFQTGERDGLRQVNNHYFEIFNFEAREALRIRLLL